VDFQVASSVQHKRLLDSGRRGAAQHLARVDEKVQGLLADSSGFNDRRVPYLDERRAGSAQGCRPFGDIGRLVFLT